jgi:hypothetical protein
MLALCSHAKEGIKPSLVRSWKPKRMGSAELRSSHEEIHADTRVCPEKLISNNKNADQCKLKLRNWRSNSFWRHKSPYVYYDKYYD